MEMEREKRRERTVEGERERRENENLPKVKPNHVMNIMERDPKPASLTPLQGYRTLRPQTASQDTLYTDPSLQHVGL